MKTVCAWCGKHIKGYRNDPVVSHGICEACMKVAIEEELPCKRDKEKSPSPLQMAGICRAIASRMEAAA